MREHEWQDKIPVALEVPWRCTVDHKRHSRWETSAHPSFLSSSGRKRKRISCREKRRRLPSKRCAKEEKRGFEGNTWAFDVILRDLKVISGGSRSFSLNQGLCFRWREWERTKETEGNRKRETNRNENTPPFTLFSTGYFTPSLSLSFSGQQERSNFHTYREACLQPCLLAKRQQPPLASENKDYEAKPTPLFCIPLHSS